MTDTHSPDLILHRGQFATLDRSNPTASAVAVKDGRFTEVGREQDIVPLAGQGSSDRCAGPNCGRVGGTGLSEKCSHRGC
jgi:hypothetical protein